MTFSTVGTPDYIAPEVLLKKGYGLECDWFVEQPMPARSGSGPIRKMLFTQDLSFVGYTYRNFAAVKGKRHSIGKYFPHKG
ncbi:putative non-specific serine/threonine protein kinase [Medicago truncatula]|uniref:Putative non-specific serine/threonine protein kinase n=1 Tax=Medicago truncatula TaxID=3880 RepID=A0A396J5X4_MEDTR|nr:putative non-specific serine/threonine protein kinase [Medicago truncatula]